MDKVSIKHVIARSAATWQSVLSLRPTVLGVGAKDLFASSPLAKIDDPLRPAAAGGAHPRRI